MIRKIIKEEFKKILAEQEDWKADVRDLQSKLDLFMKRLADAGMWNISANAPVKVEYKDYKTSGKYRAVFQMKGSVDDDVFEKVMMFLEKIGYNVDAGLSDRYYDWEDDRLNYPEIVFDKDSDRVNFKGKQVDLSSLQVDAVDLDDHPKYTDAVAVKLNFTDGTPLTDAELELFTDQNYEVIRDAAERYATRR